MCFENLMRPDEVMMPQLALAIQATNLDCGGEVLRDAALVSDSLRKSGVAVYLAAAVQIRLSSRVSLFVKPSIVRGVAKNALNIAARL